MRKLIIPRRLSRRSALKLGAGVVAAAAGARFLPGVGRSLWAAPTVARADDYEVTEIKLAATDGFIHLPGTVPIPGGDPNDPNQVFNPDPLAPPGLTTYIFGFRNVTDYPDVDAILAIKGQAQHSAPLLFVDEAKEIHLTLFNLGLALRPDLTDGHTIHWHGFRNAIPYFDGVPSTSIAVPLDRQFTYVYRPHDPGTYMYHCHFEDTEHVQMGMTGLIFVRPVQNRGSADAHFMTKYPSYSGPAIPASRLPEFGGGGPMGYAYNDLLAPGDPGSTAYDREFGLFLSEVWAEAHWADAHIQLPEWTDYKPDWRLINGRPYPDTLEGAGDLVHLPHSAAPGREDLMFQPHTALVNVNAGDRVLLRLSNLGYEEQAMTAAGLTLQVVGKDATLLRGRDGTDLSYETNTLSVAPGESFDALFTAPAYSGSGDYDTYLLYNRNYDRLRNPEGLAGQGGQMTEIRVYPSGTLPDQTQPNA